MPNSACPVGFVGRGRKATLLVAVLLVACSSNEQSGARAAGGAGPAASATAGAPGSSSAGTGGSSAVAGAASSSGGSGGTSGASGSGASLGGTSALGGSGTGASVGGTGGDGAGGVGAGAGKGGGRGGRGAAGGSSGAPTDPSGGEAGAGPTPVTGTPTLFWLDVGGKVLSSAVAPFAVKTLVPSAGQGSDGIAVDLDAGYIYWTDMGVPADNDGSLMRSKLDGSGVTTLIPVGGIYTPKQLKLVSEEKKLYWGDREGMRVMRANLDGSTIETLYTSGQGDTDRKDLSKWCVGIAVDTAGGYFYWSQKGSDTGHEGSIRRAHLTMPAGETDVNRSDVEILFDGLAAPIDLDLDLDLDAGFIYWTNRGDNTVNRGPLELPSGETATTRSDRQIIVPDVPQAIGIGLDHARGLVYYTDAVGDVGRSNLDGSNAKFLLTMSGAFTGIVPLDVP